MNCRKFPKLHLLKLQFIAVDHKLCKSFKVPQKDFCLEKV